MEHSAEWYRGAVEALGRMVDDCDTVFDSDLPHITQGNLEDYLAEYAELLAAAEAREAGEPSAAEVIRVAKAALADIRAAVTTSTGQCGVMGTNWAECDYCGAVSRERMTPIPHEKGCAVSRSTEALATISAWEGKDGQ